MINLPKILSDGAIFPRDKEIKIYGTSDEKVKVEFLGQKVDAECNNGTFMATFPPVSEYGGPYEVVIESARERKIIKDVYVGEVFLMAGQSNMMAKVKECEDDLSDAESDSLIRLFSTDHIIFFDGEIDYYRSRDGWVKCQKEFIPEWSSLCYQVGSNIRKEKNIAVGLIACYQGASCIESWLPQYAFEDKRICLTPEQKHSDHMNIAYLLWNENSRLYNLVYSQVMPYSISGAVWYQGESDTTEDEGKIYDLELAALINAWRKDFDEKDLPVVIVQIADLDCRNDSGWHSIQEAQERVANNMDNVYLAVSKDISDSYIIHPPKKKALAKRISDIIIKILGNKKSV